MGRKRAVILCGCMAGAALLALGLFILFGAGAPAGAGAIGGADGPTVIFVAGRVSGLLWAGVFGLIAAAAVVLSILLWRGRRGR